MKTSFVLKLIAFCGVIIVPMHYATSQSTGYAIVGTGQTTSYNNTTIITLPTVSDAFYGQNANHQGNVPSYTDNGDGTITDNITGLMWEKSPERNGDGTLNYSDKMTYASAMQNAASCRTGGYTDWRLPTIKEQYSLIMFYGAEPNPTATSQGSAAPYINTNYFTFAYGDLNATSHGATSNERLIDAQYASSTLYVSTTMGGNSTMFGVNFADGRIKGYPSGNQKKYYVLYVRSNINYGKNNFTNNGDGTVTDNATGLMWMQNDNGVAVSWEDALTYAEGYTFAGHSDWRLPDAKELQSILDYSRSPETSNSAAIDPVFGCTQITNEAGKADYGYYWSNTTFCSQSTSNGKAACYLSFGRAMGYMANLGGWIDVHGAGAQRSDPKTGDPNDYPYGFGPQGDAIRINNFVRLVRTVSAPSHISATVEKPGMEVSPNPASGSCKISLNKHYKQVALAVYDAKGLKIREMNYENMKDITISLIDFPDGVFLFNAVADYQVLNRRVAKLKY